MVMHFNFMTPHVWNGLVLGTVIIGLALAILRLYSDFTRPMPRAKRKKPEASFLDTGHDEQPPFKP
jgi:hypothetical protein